MSFQVKHITIRALNQDVLVYNMDFGEVVLASGIVIKSDDGKVHGIKPRWAKVYKVGPKQDEVSEGQWILVEHGRWTRKIKIDDGTGVKEVQKVDTAAILAVSDIQPLLDYIGTEYADGTRVDIRPEDFM
jgi:hypothetical protein